TITVNPMPTAGLDGSIQMCPTADAIALFPVLGGTPDPGGTWTAPGGLVHGDLFDPATDAPGVYTYTVLGSAPCPGDIVTATVQVFLVPAPEAGNNSISCTLGETLSATGTWSTGQWSGPAGTLLAHPDSATTTVSAISAGAYVFIWGTVSAEGCASSDSVQVTFTDPILPTVTATETICHGSCDGGAVVTATGGNVLDGAYAFQWSGGMGGNSATAAGFCAGSYVVTVVDTNGCAATANFTILEPEALAIDQIIATDVLCPNHCDGTLLIADTDGVQFSLSGGPFQAANSFTDLCPGSYTVTMLDANGCSA